MSDTNKQFTTKFLETINDIKPQPKLHERKKHFENKLSEIYLTLELKSKTTDSADYKSLDQKYQTNLANLENTNE